MVRKYCIKPVQFLYRQFDPEYAFPTEAIDDEIVMLAKKMKSALLYSCYDNVLSLCMQVPLPDPEKPHHFQWRFTQLAQACRPAHVDD